jgi:putative SOS response-associated peptidase YedK
VQPVHAKAMPVLLEPDQFETWLTAPVEEALALQ